MKIPVQVKAEIELTHREVFDFIHMSNDHKVLFGVLIEVMKAVTKRQFMPGGSNPLVGSEEHVIQMTDSFLQYLRGARNPISIQDMGEIQMWSASKLAAFITDQSDLSFREKDVNIIDNFGNWSVMSSIYINDNGSIVINSELQDTEP